MERVAEMARNRALVRASDLSAWAYCNRAWWLANVQGVPHQEPEQLERGTAAHARHGRNLARAQRLQQVAMLGFALAALLLLLAVAVQVIK